jgi:UDP-glucuronate decarboxylase
MRLTDWDKDLTMWGQPRLLIELTGSSSKIVYQPLPQDDPKQRQPDISTAQKVLGWSPQVQLRQGLTKTIEFFEQLLRSGNSLEKVRSIASR